MKRVVKPCRRSRAVLSPRFPLHLALALMVGSLLLPDASLARQNSVTGTLSLGSDYDSNVFKSDRDRKDEWRSLLAPVFSAASKGLTDTLSVTYAPEFGYNHRREDDEMTQALSFAADKGLSSRWKVTLNGEYAAYDNLFFEADPNLSVVQNFLRADSATQAEIVRLLFPELVWDPVRHTAEVISQLQSRFDRSADQVRVRELLFQGANGVRQRYWTSGVTLNSTYEFADQSTLVLGYRCISQDNTTGLMADHLGQTPSLLLTYQFNQQWRGEVGYDLSIDTYDTSDDTKTSHPHLQVDYHLSLKDRLFWNYDFTQISFDQAFRDTTDQGTTIGWNHAFDQRTSLSTALGTSYLGHELVPDERAYTLDLGLTRTFERGTVAVRGVGMTAVANTLGGWERSRQSWEISSDLTCRLGQDLSSSGRLSYGQWDFLGSEVNLEENSYDQLRIGAGLNYLFKRWYTLSLDYDYSLFDTDGRILNDYNEHLLSLKLAAAKELWRW